MEIIFGIIGLVVGVIVGIAITSISFKILGTLLIDRKNEVYYVTLDNGSLSRLPRNGSYLRLKVKEADFSDVAK